MQNISTLEPTEEFKKEFWEILGRIRSGSPDSLCACGCGLPVYPNAGGRMPRYVAGHSSRRRESIRKMVELLERIPDGLTQAELRSYLKPGEIVNDIIASKAAVRLEKLGLIRRERTLVNERWTFRLWKTGSNPTVQAAPPTPALRRLQKRTKELMERLEEDGFIPLESLTYGETGALLNVYSYGARPAARRITISTGSATLSGGHGSIKYSSLDFVGFQFRREYLVLDEGRFRSSISKELEGLFFKNNPNPTKGLRQAFTRMMHDNGLHWSGCEHQRSAPAQSGQTPGGPAGQRTARKGYHGHGVKVIVDQSNKLERGN